MMESRKWMASQRHLELGESTRQQTVTIDGWRAARLPNHLPTLQCPPPSPSHPCQRSFLAACRRAHTDFDFVTLLLTDDQPWLQILLEGAWVDVPPMPDCLILNVGDILHRWTNGRFKSVLHRVVNCGRERYSTPFFLCEWVVWVFQHG